MNVEWSTCSIMDSMRGSAERKGAMQGVQSRPSGFAAVTLTLTLFLALAGTSAHAQDKKPDEVLKGRGLKRAAERNLGSSR